MTVSIVTRILITNLGQINLLTYKCDVCGIAIGLKPQNLLPVMLNCSQYGASRLKY